MNKKIIISVIVVTIIVLTLIGIVSLKNPQTESKTGNTGNNTKVTKIRPDKIEVFLFHATQRCNTCITIGKYAGETVAESFQPEIWEGRIEFKEINIDLPENKTLVQKFQASGSSLFINVITSGQDNISEDTTVWRLTQDKAQFKIYLKNKLDNLLGE